MLRGLTQRGCGGGLTPVRAAGRYMGAFQDGKALPMEQGARISPGRASRRRAHAPGQAEGADAEGLRGGTDACAGGWQLHRRVA